MISHSFGPTGRIVLAPQQRHPSVLLAQQAAARPHNPFLSIEGRTWSYAQARDQVLRVAAGLAREGVAEGSRVGVLLPNCAEFVFLWFACAHLGATTVAINPQFRGALLDNAMGPSGCTVAVLHTPSADALESLSPEVRDAVRTVVAIGAAAERAPGAIPLRAWTEAPVPADLPPRGDHRSIQVISFTSGSTGPSKGVLITNTQALDSACTYVHAVRLTAEDTLYTPFAFFHGMSTRLGVLPTLLAGGHVVVGQKFSASRYWQEAIECGATVGQTLPPMTAMLKALPAAPHDTAHRVTRMYNSRADEEFEARFGVKLVEAYGMTEIGLPIYSAFGQRRQGAAGQVHPDWEMAIVDDEDQPVAPGATGELVFRPRVPWLMMQGYVGRPDATVEANRNLWFHSGDIGRQDADGYVYFIDRRKERIRRLGENISSFDVESLVSSHPDVRECAALAHPANVGEDDVRIIVVAAEGAGLSAAKLYDWLTRVMPRYMLPRYIEFTDALPRTPTNKIEKLKLKEAGLPAHAWDRDQHHAPVLGRAAAAA
ncbi:ATP-dependent acyl-CoA ligase [Ramlibacter sp. G-1-2-2]|uniref:ATP-dependent acyl-CoA ligase n=1 Tax=Ramlibacter agri TaxID=2728837 RepID=A0A848H427_9BURK|nr:ATP-dependent acyl-CoA ligase [Ramlibacter agri]